jgi:hypothetical protein
LAGAPAIAILLLVGCSSSSNSGNNAPGDTLLSGLTLSSTAGPLTAAPAFNPNTTAYTLTVGGPGPITVKAVLDDPSATLLINGVATPSNTASAPITLKTGSNLINVAVLAANGLQVYTVTVTSLSQNASLAALTVAGGNGDIVPAFAQATPAYTLKTNFMANPAAVTVKATLADPNASMTVNGTALASNTVSSPIPTKVGNNPITIVVKAQDGVTSQTYTISNTTYAQNTSIRVQEASNSNPVASALITVADAAGNVLQSNIPVSATGTATLGLDGASRYNLSAVGAGTAVSMIAGYDSSRETIANLYCHPLGMINFPAVAPQITAISYGPDGTKWTPVAGNAISATLASLARLKVTALGGSNIASTAWSGFGMGLMVDQPAWAFAYNGYYVIDEQAVPVTVGAATLYRTTAEMGVPFTNYVPKSNHYIDLVVYDVANNRTEQKLYLNVTDGAADTTQADLSTLAPSKLTAQLITFGITRNLFSISQVDGTPTGYEPDFFFTLANAAGTVQKITGYEIQRSTDASTWNTVGTRQYTTATAASSLAFTDLDPTLKENVLYYYRVRCFNGNTTNNGGNSQWSVPIASAFLPAFTTRLSSPAHGAISTSLAPKLSFSITNPALFDPAVSDYFYFYLNVTEKTNSAAGLAQAYRYNFLVGRFEASIGGVWSDASSTVSVDAAHSTITIVPPGTYFMPGVTYQWSIFGTATTNAAGFRKYTYPYNDPTSVNYGVAISYGSTYELSYGAVNGYYTLTIDPNAK